MYFNAKFNVFFKSIEVHLLARRVFIVQYGLNVIRLILVLEELSFREKINAIYNLRVYI